VKGVAMKTMESTNIEETVNHLFEEHKGELTKEDIFTMVVGAAVRHLANKQLFEEDPLSDEDDLAVDLATKIINEVEDLINNSTLPTEKVAAYGAKAIYGLANMRDI